MSSVAIASPPDRNDDLTVYLDMDGVLVDFNNGFRRLSSGLDLKKYAETFGEPIARDRYLKAGPSFWVNLDWIRGGQEVWNAANSLFEDVCILSSAGTTDQEKAEIVEIGKRAWLKKNIPSIPDEKVFIVKGKHMKQKMAARDSILVDDVAETIRQWTQGGGYGILHSSQNYKKTIEELEDLARPIKLSELAKRMKR